MLRVSGFELYSRWVPLIGSQQMLRLRIWPSFKRSPSVVRMYCTLCFSGLKVKNFCLNPVLEWAAYSEIRFWVRVGWESAWFGRVRQLWLPGSLILNTLADGVQRRKFATRPIRMKKFGKRYAYEKNNNLETRRISELWLIIATFIMLKGESDL